MEKIENIEIRENKDGSFSFVNKRTGKTAVFWSAQQVKELREAYKNYDKVT